MTAKPSNKKLKRTEVISQKEREGGMLLECAWEACNQVGGIYTVLRSKAPFTTARWGENYYIIGPYFYDKAQAEFEPSELDGSVGKAAQDLRNQGIEVHTGTWLVTGRPKVVLINPFSVFSRLGEVKYLIFENHGISFHHHDELMDQVLAFGFAVKELMLAVERREKNLQLLAHFHEWMAGIPIPMLKHAGSKVPVNFTTHATLLGRYLAMNDPDFYDHLPFADWEKESRHFNIEPAVRIERAAAHGAEVFSTVSEVTAHECTHLLGRTPDLMVPNGFNVERFEALHEFQNLHMHYKERIHEFTAAHFFQNYTFDLDKTVYFFTSGRYEYRNKGFDLTLEALARLNHKLKQSKSDVTVVMFFITRQPYHSISPQILQSLAMVQEIEDTIESIKKQIGERLFYKAAGAEDQRLPDLNALVDDYWRLRFRRTLQGWKSRNLPPVVTHSLKNDQDDELLNFIRTANLLNYKEDRVKIVYHPDFINTTNPLFGMEYHNFVRGCHMGVFPSYYEPWGYTPLECLASGIPAITSDLSGFGDFVLKNYPSHDENGLHIIKRFERVWEDAASQLTYQMMNFLKMSRRDRIVQRNSAEQFSTLFAWDQLGQYYDKAYKMALQRKPA